ncbi:hypothetical protein D3C79_908920 [compost metagenome]
MLDAQAGRQADTPVAQPGVDGASALVEGHRLAGFVTEGRHRHGTQVLLLDGVADAVHVQVFAEQLAQG